MLNNVTRFQAIRSIALALDYVSNAETSSHALRVAGFSLLIARELGCSDEEILFIIESALLHDIGVANRREHQIIVSTFGNANTRKHCLRGSKLLRQYELFDRYHKVVEFHHTSCPDLALYPHLNLKERLFSNVIYAADRAAIVFDDKIKIFRTQPEDQVKATLTASIKGLENNYFCTEVVRAFSSGIQKSSLPSDLSSHNISKNIEDISRQCQPYFMNEVQFLSFAELLSNIVDGKGSVSNSHSQGLALIATDIGQHLALPEQQLGDLYLAALIHDIGLLRQNDYSFHKSDGSRPIDPGLIEQIREDTQAILMPVCGKSPLLDWVTKFNTEVDEYGFHNSVCLSMAMPFQVLTASHLFLKLANQGIYNNDQIASQLQHAANNKNLNAEVVDIIINNIGNYSKIIFKINTVKPVKYGPSA